MKVLLVLLFVGTLSRCWAKESLSVNKCILESDPGFCLLHVEKFFYNSKSRQCESFVYNGCGGNENNFQSKNECERSCRQAPFDEMGDDVEDNKEEEEVEKISGPSRNLFGKLFQKSLLTTFDAFKPDPMFDVFDINEDDDDAEIKRKPALSFANTYDFLRPKIRAEFDPFAKHLTGSLFKNLWSNTMKTFRENFDNSFKKLSKNLLEKSIVSNNTMQCYVCKEVVSIIEYELNVLKMSVEYILTTVQFICKFFPLAEKSCQTAVSDIKAIIKYIAEGLSPERICEKIKLCSSTLPEGVAQSVSITFSRKCSPLCNFIKITYEEKAMKMAKSWNEAKMKLKRFCDDKKIIKKCDIFFRMLEKSFAHLSNITGKQNVEHCKCFRRQPLFDTKKFDSCLRCKQFKRGMVNELQQLNQSMQSLTSRVRGLCQLFPTKVCRDIVEEFRSSLSSNIVTMDNICNVTGYCGNTEKNSNLVGHIKESFGNFGSIFPDANHMIMRRKRLTPGCLFCKKCMGDLKETFKNINETKNVYPAVREGFRMYCQTRSVGTDHATVCRKISNGIETVHKVITKRGNEEGMCKTLGLC